MGILSGYRVLDCSIAMAGPFAAQRLGDLGADVVKVEPITGEWQRHTAAGGARGNKVNVSFLSLNRNKRSLAIDLKSKEGIEIIHRLLPTIDVLVHNMRVPAMERLGLGYKALAAMKPDLVYCVATGFGESGPDAGKPAFDDVIQAASGLAALIGQEDGKPDYAPTLLADKTCGMALCNAVLAGLLHRARTGAGQQIEVPMLETMVAFNMAEHLGGLTFEGPDAPNAPAGYARLLAGGRKPAPTRDGYVALLPYSGDDWVNFFKEAGRDDLAREFDLKDKHERNAKVKELYAAMHDVTRQMTTDACMALCDRLDIPATRLWSIQDLPNHPHLKAVDFFEHVEHPTEGPIRSVRTPTLFGATPAQTPRPAPHIGQHTEELLREAGYDGKAIAEMSSRGIVACFAMP